MSKQINTRKIIINLPTEQIEFIQKLAAKEEISFSDVLIRAINSEKFFIENEGKILIKDGNRIRVVIRK